MTRARKASNNVIPVGQSKDSTYVAFGDDCQFEDICGYAFAVVKRSRIPWVIRELNAIKAHFRFPTGVPVHCKVLFHGSKRTAAGLDHLNRTDAESIVIRCLMLINNAGVHVRFSHASLQASKNKLGDTLNMWDHVKNVEVRVPVNHAPKGLISLLAQLCLLVPAPERRFARPEEWEIVISRDKTQVKWIGKGERQAHNLINAFSTINVPEGQFNHFTPRISTEATDSLLELADVAVYALCHALNVSEKEVFWRTQLPSIRSLHVVQYPMSG
jgi:hypothetical protein